MRWTRSEVLAAPMQNVSAEEYVTLEPSAFEGFSLINSAKDILVKARGFLDPQDDLFYVTLEISGVMLLPDAITGEEIEYPFTAESEEIYSFEETEDESIRIVTDDVIELLPAVTDAVLMEVPLQVTYASEEDYPQGDGWAVISEEAYMRDRQSRIDPRLAKLKEYKEEE